ncbi:hypothetical protein DL89DRAFT_273214 [Linderina pennispora]|uniref:Uncharacterized protein n=1 Tax=Linderina pennispora TaxID=61395 RepID=A0A1Y1VQP9_9FUNG|nr:uncharacterized protein DL89DRAFT_273214 [Linderina pennispora]ORX63600.1 hypothetical protein DL89DRAFT_273214 [Linderina pennispora]
MSEYWTAFPCDSAESVNFICGNCNAVFSEMLTLNTHCDQCCPCAPAAMQETSRRTALKRLLWFP